MEFSRRELLGIAGLSIGAAELVRPSLLSADRTVDGSELPWPHPRHDPGNTAVTSDPGPGNAGMIAWKRQTALTSADRLGGVGLLLTDDELLLSGDATLRGLDPADGSERWQYTEWSGDEDRKIVRIRSRVRDGIAFLATGAGVDLRGNNLRGSVLAVDLDSRRLRWRYPTERQVQRICLLGNTLYLSVDGGPTVALDARSGFERWRQDEQATPLAATERSLVVYDDRFHGTLAALDPEDGRRCWRVDPEIGTSRSAQLRYSATEEIVVARTLEGTLLLDTETGDRCGAVDTGADNRTTDSLAVDADRRRVYRSLPGIDEMRCCDFDGEEVWRQPVEGLSRGLSVGGDTVYASGTTGVVAFDADTGEQLFRLDLDIGDQSGVSITPIVAGERVFHAIGDTVYGVVPDE